MSTFFTIDYKILGLYTTNLGHKTRNGSNDPDE